MYGHRKSVDRTFKRIMNEGKENFLPIVTGHQGEPRAMLTRMGRGETPYELENGDKVISRRASSPSRPTRASATSPRSYWACRAHVSTTTSTSPGHLREEGHYKMLDALQPQNIIPAHQDMKGFAPYVDLCSSQGYELSP